MKEVNRLDGAYPDLKASTMRDLAEARELILTEADIQKQLETDRLPIIEEGKIIDNPGDKENEDNNHSN